MALIVLVHSSRMFGRLVRISSLVRYVGSSKACPKARHPLFTRNDTSAGHVRLCGFIPVVRSIGKRRMSPHIHDQGYMRVGGPTSTLTLFTPTHIRFFWWNSASCQAGR